MNTQVFARRFFVGMALSASLAVGIFVAPALAQESPVMCWMPAVKTIACVSEAQCLKVGGTVQQGACSPSMLGSPTKDTNAPAAQPGKVTAMPPPQKVVNLLPGVETIPQLIGRVITIFTGLVGSLALLGFVIGGLMVLTSQGSDKKVQEGKNILVASSLGLAIIFAAYALVKFVFSAIGV